MTSLIQASSLFPFLHLGGLSSLHCPAGASHARFAAPLRVPLLFAASVAFYFFMMPAALPILALFTVAVYFAGLAVAGRRRKVPPDGTADGDMDTPTAPRKKTLAALFLFGTVAFLAVFKYLPWIAGGVTGREFSLLVPLGISYFTFSAISYLADLSAGKIEAQRSFLALALYIFFFPKITAGPIERPAPFFDSLRRLEDPASPPSGTDGRRSCSFFPASFASSRRQIFSPRRLRPCSTTPARRGKPAFPCSLPPSCSHGSSTPTSPAIPTSPVAALSFSASPARKFRHPLRRREHQGILAALAHLPFLLPAGLHLHPLGGSRRGKGKKYRNLLLTFLVSGLWHGAGLPYLLWGALHGLLQILEDLLAPLRRRFTSRLKKGERSPVYRVPAVLLTFVLVDLCWIVFRSASLGDLVTLLSSLGSMGDPAAAWEFVGLTLPGLVTVCASLLLAHFLHRLPSRRLTPDRLAPALPLLAAILLGLFLLLLYFSRTGGGGAFIYVDF